MFLWKEHCGKITHTEGLKQCKFILLPCGMLKSKIQLLECLIFSWNHSAYCAESCAYMWPYFCVSTTLLLLPPLRRPSIRLCTYKRQTSFIWSLLNWVFWDRTLVYRPGWSGIPHLLASASWVLGIKTLSTQFLGFITALETFAQ